MAQTFELNSSAQILYQMREEVLDDWLHAIKMSIHSAATERIPILTNTIPAFIVNMAQALSPAYSRDLATDNSTIAEEHGGERARITKYGPDDIVEEYQLLREIILAKLGDKTLLTKKEESIIRRSCDKAMTESLNAFFLVLNGIREQFTTTLTHDLRTPLNVIHISASLMKIQASDPEKVKKLGDTIISNAKRLDRMIQNVLDASTLRSGETMGLNFELCDLYQMTESTIEEQNIIHGQRFRLDGAPVQGYWDGESLKRAIENLCTNAVKYGSDYEQIKVKIIATHGRVILTVHNKGSYIPSEDQETIFNSFRRTQSAKASGAKGWGIGLTLVRSVAEGHGGSVGVESSMEEGTTFLIDILQDARPTKDKPHTPGTP